MKRAIIFASGNLDEYRVAESVAARAPIDSFGIGASLVTSAEHLHLDAVYKPQEYAGRPRRKRSTGKATWPGRKQVYRHYAPDGTFLRDVVTLEGDAQDGEPLVQPVAERGRRLPAPLRSLEPAWMPYPVEIATALKALAAEVDRASGA